MLAYKPVEVECSRCRCQMQAITVKGRPRFFRRDAKGADRSITHCPGCDRELVAISTDQVLEQAVRTP